jgi:hypothetical protein
MTTINKRTFFFPFREIFLSQLDFFRNRIMLNRCISSSVRQSFGLIVARHLSLSASLAQQSKQQQQATDPIQQLFINKIREYNEKKKLVFLIEMNF